MPYIDIEKVLELDYKLRLQSKSGFLDVLPTSEERTSALNREVLQGADISKAQGSRGRVTEITHSNDSQYSKHSVSPIDHVSRSREHAKSETSPEDMFIPIPRRQFLEQGSPKPRLPSAASTSTPKISGTLGTTIVAPPKPKPRKSIEQISAVKWRPVKSQDTFHDGSNSHRASATSAKPKRRRLVKGSEVEDTSMSRVDPALYDGSGQH
jgi:hypothetical protein